MRRTGTSGGAHAAPRKHPLPRWVRGAVAVGLGGALVAGTWTGVSELVDPDATWDAPVAPAAPAEAGAGAPDALLVQAAAVVRPLGAARTVPHTVSPPTVLRPSRSERRADRSLTRLADRREVALERLAVDAEQHAEELVARQREARRAARLARELAATAGVAPMADGSTAWVRPVGDYYLTARFGDAGSRWSSTHTGLDFAAPTGTPVVSVGAGTVTFAGSAGAYGSKVEVTHADGTETWYAHLAAITVTAGQTVPRGGMIGTVGLTGNTSGPHLHLEVRPDGGDAVDPVAALRARGVLL